MKQYFQEVMDRLSVEALVTMLVVISLLLIRDLFKAKPKKEGVSKASMACPMCGKGGGK